MQKSFHNTFTFLDWTLDPEAFTLSLSYEIQGVGKVTELLTFPEFIIRPELIDSVNTACELIHLMCGISYYKSGLAESIVFKGKRPSEYLAQFIEKTWFHGLGELAFENKVSLRNHINMPFDESVIPLSRKLDLSDKSLVPLGGGKDSLVTIEELKKQDKEINLFMVGNSQLIKEVAEFIGLPLIQVKRKIDGKLIEYNKTLKGFNGHVPITAINSSIAVLTALLFDFNAVVFSNESSANSANTINTDGDEVNHQYSKSEAFENDFSHIVAKEITPSLHYFSQQRQCTELEILEKFSQYPQYFPVFSSCNRNFHIDGSHNIINSKWCGSCPKCQFVFLGLAPFVEKQQLLAIFGSNLFNDLEQQQGFSELLGLRGFKPFECVGEIEESREAFSQIMDKEAWKKDILVRILKNSWLNSLESLRHSNIAIWGFGVEGKATAEYLNKYEIDFKVLCKDSEINDQYLCITKTVDVHLLNTFDVIIKSPGISSYSKLVNETTARVTSPTAIWFANENKEKDTSVIAVTGTKGKSTTVSLLAHILEYCEKSVNLVGNIGQPLITASCDVDYIVLESSSFQIYDGNIQSDIAVVTNLYAEHVDWHNGKGNYFKDKLQLISGANIKIINAQNPILNNLIKNNDVDYFNLNTGYHVIDDKLLYIGNEVLELSEINLIGKHNLENIGAALTVCEKLELDISKCVEAIKIFKPLAHRLQNLGKIGQHYVINDSIATTPLATMAALETLDTTKTTLLIGGFDRGNDWMDFAKELIKLPPNLLIISGDNGTIIHNLLKSLHAQFNFVLCHDLKESIQIAQRQSNKGDTIILSPGAPSFDQFDSYIKRGEFFEMELKNNV